jgi:hypothetical protein
MKSAPGEGGTRVNTFRSDDLGALSRKELFQVLQNRYRRHVIHYLKQDSQAAEISSVATQLAAWKNDLTPQEVTDEQRRKMQNILYEDHLLKLAEAGIVSINEDNTIELTDLAKDVEIYLEFSSNSGISWGKYYLFLSAFYAALLIASMFTVGPFTGISPIEVSATFSVLLLISSILYYREQKRGRIGRSGAPVELQNT